MAPVLRPRSNSRRSSRLSPSLLSLVPLLLATIYLLPVLTPISLPRNRPQGIRNETTTKSETTGLHSAATATRGTHECVVPSPLPPLLSLSSTSISSASSFSPTHIESYLKLHAAARARLASNHSAAPALVWRCMGRFPSPCHGLGDRLRGIRLTFLIAVLTGRAFFIDTPPTPFPLTAAVVPAYLDWTVPPALAAALPTLPGPVQPGLAQIRAEADAEVVVDAIEQTSATVAQIDWISNFSVVAAALPDGSTIDLTAADLSAVLRDMPPALSVSVSCGQECVRAITRNPSYPVAVTAAATTAIAAAEIEKAVSVGASSIDTAVQNDTALSTDNSVGHSAEKVSRTLASLLFVPAPAVASRLESRGFGPGGWDSYAAAHLRTGDDVSETSHTRFASVQNTSAELLAENLLTCVRRAVPRVRRIALATDSRRHAQLFSRAAKRAGIDTHVSPGRALHIARPRQWAKNGAAVEASATAAGPNDASGDGAGRQAETEQTLVCNGFRDVFADLFIMARADVLVGSGSGFSKGALYMGQADGRVYFQAGRDEAGRCVSCH